jgi:hypothetical protein
LTEPWPWVRSGCDGPERSGPIIRPHQ